MKNNNNSSLSDIEIISSKPENSQIKQEPINLVSGYLNDVEDIDMTGTNTNKSDLQSEAETPTQLDTQLACKAKTELADENSQCDKEPQGWGNSNEGTFQHGKYGYLPHPTQNREPNANDMGMYKILNIFQMIVVQI